MTQSRTAGEAPFRRFHASRLAGVLLMALALVAVVFASAIPRSAYAEPGYVQGENGVEAYADVIASDLQDGVQYLRVGVGSDLSLTGDFSGGWGAVSLTWACSQEASTYLLHGLMDDAAACDWQHLSSVVVAGSLPDFNHAVKPGGVTQVLELQNLQEGLSAFRLTAVDDAGFSHSIYWLVEATDDVNALALLMMDADEVQEPGTAQASTNIYLKSVEQIKEEIKEDDRQIPNRVRPGQAALARTGDNGLLPQTGDQLGAVVAGLLAAIAASCIVGAVYVRQRRQR